MGHERTITVGQDGRYFNVPTVDREGQKTLTVKEALRRGRERNEPGFLSVESAVEAAKARSRRPHAHGFEAVTPK